MKIYKLIYITVLSTLLTFSICTASLSELRGTGFETEQQEVEVAADKNALTDQILAQASLPAGFAGELLALLDDPAQGTIWHNYLLQKLDALYLHPDGADQRDAILARLWKESRSPTPSFAGTAQMSLLRLYEQRPEVVDAQKLIRHTQWVIERTVYSNSDRLSALHVLSALDYTKSTQIARTWLTIETTPILLKTTAIAVLGKEFQQSDTRLIKPYLNHSDLRLRAAARTALNNDKPNG